MTEDLDPEALEAARAAYVARPGVNLKVALSASIRAYLSTQQDLWRVEVECRHGRIASTVFSGANAEMRAHDFAGLGLADRVRWVQRAGGG